MNPSVGSTTAEGSTTMSIINSIATSHRSDKAAYEVGPYLLAAIGSFTVFKPTRASAVVALR